MTSRPPLDPADAGLAIDYEATIAKLGAGRSWAPTDIRQVLTGGGSVDPVVQVDDAALASAVKTAATTLDATARDATITPDGAEIVTTDAVDGVAVDQAATADALRTSWLTTTTVDAPTVVTEPAVTTDEVKTLAADTLTPALSGPITFTTDKGKVTLTPEMIAKATTITSRDGLVTAETSPAKLWDAAQDQIDDLDFTDGRDATWKLVNGSPTVVPSSDGQGISEDEFTKQVTALLTSTTGRTAKLATVSPLAGFTTAMAKKLGVKEVTGEFTTYFPYAEYRNNNLRAAASINNSFLRPGEIFSLNDTLGQRTAANGYMDGWVIVGNQLQKEVGGGAPRRARPPPSTWPSSPASRTSSTTPTPCTSTATRPDAKPRSTTAASTSASRTTPQRWRADAGVRQEGVPRWTRVDHGARLVDQGL